MAQKPVGTMIVELTLDDTKYTAGQKRILAGAQQNSKDINVAMKTVGTQSDIMYDAMRKNIENALSAIKKSHLSSSDEIRRAQEGAAAKIKSINEQQFGHHTGLIDNLKNHWMAATAAIAGASMLAAKAFSMIDKAADIEEMTGAVDKLAGKFGTTAGSLVQQIQKSSEGMIGFSVATKSAGEAMLKGFDPSMLAKFAATAKTFSDFSGEKVSDVYVKLVESITTGRERAIKGLVGIMELENRYSKEQIDNMSDLEKAHAKANMVFEKTAEIQKIMGDAVETTADKIEKARVKMEDYEHRAGQKVLEYAKTAVGIYERIAGFSEKMGAKVYDFLGIYRDFANQPPGGTTAAQPAKADTKWIQMQADAEKRWAESEKKRQAVEEEAAKKQQSIILEGSANWQKQQDKMLSSAQEMLKVYEGLYGKTSAVYIALSETTNEKIIEMEDRKLQKIYEANLITWGQVTAAELIEYNKGSDNMLALGEKRYKEIDLMMRDLANARYDQRLALEKKFQGEIKDVTLSAQDEIAAAITASWDRVNANMLSTSIETAQETVAAVKGTWSTIGGITQWAGGISESGAPNIGEYTGLPVGIINTAGTGIINAINSTYAQQASARQAEEERERQEQQRLWEDSVRAQEQYQAEQQRLWDAQIAAQKRFVESLKGQNQTIADWLNEMTRGNLAPVQWAGSWTDEYSRQKALAYAPARAGKDAAETAANETAKAKDVSAYLSYAKEYLEFQKSYGNAGSYQTAYSQVTKDISYLGDIKNIEDMLGSMGLGTVETDLRKVIKAFADVGASTNDLKEFMLAYNAVLLGNDGAVVQTKDVGLYMGYAAFAAGKTKEALDTYTAATQTAAGDTATGAMIGALEDYRLKTIDTVGDNTTGTRGLIAGLDAYIAKAGEAGSSDETKGTGALFKSLRDYIDKTGAAAGDAGTAGLTSAIGDYIKSVTDPNGAVDAITGKNGLNAAIDAYVEKTGSFVGDANNGTGALKTAIDAYVEKAKLFVGNPTIGTGALLDSMGKYVGKTGEAKEASDRARDAIDKQTTATGYSGLTAAAGTAAAILTEQTKATGITSGVAGAAQVAKTELEKQKDATGNLSGAASSAADLVGGVGGLSPTIQDTKTPFENVMGAFKTLTGETGLGGVEKYFEALATKLGTPFTASAGTAAAAAIIASAPIQYQEKIVNVPAQDVFTHWSTKSAITDGLGHVVDYAYSYWVRNMTTGVTAGPSDRYIGKGGLTNGVSIAGEIGPEWVAPTYEPERSNFLRDTGVAQTLKEILIQTGGGSGDGRPIVVNLVVDGRVLGNVMAKQARTNPEYIDSIRRLN